MDNHYQLTNHSLIKPTLLSNTNWEKAKKYELSGPINGEFFIKPKEFNTTCNLDKDFIKFYVEALESSAKNQYKTLIENTYYALVSLINIRNQIPDGISLVDYDNWDIKLKKRLANLYVKFSNDYGLLGILPHILFQFPTDMIRINDDFVKIKVDAPIISLSTQENKLERIRICLTKKIEPMVPIYKLINIFFPPDITAIKPTVIECVENTAVYSTQYSEPLFLVLLAIDRIYSSLYSSNSKQDEKIKIHNSNLEYSYDNIDKQYSLKTSFNSLYDLLLYTSILLKFSTTNKIIICKSCKTAVLRKTKANNDFCQNCYETERKRKYREIKSKQ